MTPAEQIAALVSNELADRGLPSAVCVGELEPAPHRARWRAVALELDRPPPIAWSLAGEIVLVPPGWP